MNDKWIWPALGLKAFHLEIYNRWGQCVHRTENAEVGWDGEGVPEGVYLWLLRYQGSNGRFYNEKGTVQVIR